MQGAIQVYEDKDVSTYRRPDRRAWRRHRRGLFLLVRFIVKPSFQSIWGVIADFTPAGLGLVSTRWVDPGAALAIQLEDLRADLCYVVRATVKHVTRQDKGNWLLGCQFTRPLEPEERECLTGDLVDV
jgi:hypothetical protein